jgi:D,D-heptose 1,7-bisphosphate phosphatase
MKQAIILAGGKGTRLQSRLHGLPKPLVNVCGIPLLEHQIELLIRHQFKNIILLVNYGADIIVDFLNSKNWNIKIKCINDGEPLGTAGATIAAYDQLQENFLVVYGDTMLDINLDRFEGFHKADSKTSATLFLHPNDHPQDSDLVEMDEDNIIVAFHSYPHSKEIYLPNLVNAGLYWLQKDALDLIGHERKFLDFGKDVFPSLIKKGAILRGYNSPEYIKDCGTPDRLDKVCIHYQSGRIAAQNLNALQSAVFLDRDGTINQELGRISKPEDFHLIAGASDAIKLLNNSLYRTIVVTNQPVIARGDCTELDLKKIHNKMETDLGGFGAYLDRIEFCPHHPDNGFSGERVELKTQCTCRKPETGMIKKAMDELNLDLSRSWLIGDSSADILAAKRSGLKSVLVETGHAGLDEKYPVLPDFISPNLLAASSFILHSYPRLRSLIDNLNLDIAPGNFVLVGGLSRSGKSTFANCLKYSLIEKNIDAKVISIDGWLKKDRYKNDNDVISRYDFDAIESVIKTLLDGKAQEVDIPIYSKKSGYAKAAEKINCINTKTVYIFEGTIALYFTKLIEKKRLRSIYLDADEESRATRVVREYKIRGKASEEALEIYNARTIDETPLITESRNWARCCINLNLNEN